MERRVVSIFPKSVALLLASCLLAACETNQLAKGSESTGDKAEQKVEVKGLPLDPSLEILLAQPGRANAFRAQNEALESGKAGVPILWDQSDDLGKAQVIPGPVYSVNDRVCRDFTHIFTKEGKIYRLRNVACKGQTGPWQFVGL